MFVPAFEGLPIRRLIISFLSIFPPACYFIYFRSILPPFDLAEGKARSEAITTYWFCGAFFTVGASIYIEDPLTIALSSGILALIILRLLSWKRRLIGLLAAGLVPTLAIKLALEKFGILIEIPDSADGGRIAIAALIAFIFVVKEK